jgi:hypothetical protein
MTLHLRANYNRTVTKTFMSITSKLTAPQYSYVATAVTALPRYGSGLEPDVNRVFEYPIPITLQA